MAMDLRDPNVWISHLLENLPEEKLASALKDDNPNWEYIDGEIVKRVYRRDRLFSGCRLSIVVVAGLSGAAATVTG